MTQHVWTGNNLNVLVYYDDGNGNRVNVDDSPFVDGVDLPILDYCYVETATVHGTLNNQRRPETGRLRQRIVTEDWIYEMSVSHLYFQKSLELPLATIFNREQPLQLDMFFYDPGSGQTEDHHWLKIAYSIDFDIQSQDNRNVVNAPKFIAEIFE